MQKLLFSLCLLCLLSTVVLAQRADGKGKTPVSKPLYDMDGKPVLLRNVPDRKGTVLIFLASDCPVANSYAPDIRLLTEEYSSRKIAIYLVYIDADATPQSIRRHNKEYQLSCPAILDRSLRLSKQMKATVSPEVFLLASDGKPLYQGRFDNRVQDYGQEKHEATVFDLQEALEALLAGKPKPFRKTKSVGCPIPAVP
jgi:hypothetical protein